MNNSEEKLKDFFGRAILVGLVAAGLAFAYSLYLPKFWRVTGKIVIVPSGTSATAGQNLYLEAANTAEMINSPSFRKNIFAEQASLFASAGQAEQSSTVAVNFESAEEDLSEIEDVIVNLPRQLAEYTRDIYGGSPFKYLLASDPEISSRPVRPNVIQNVFRGFGAGALVYFLYWLYFASIFGRGAKIESRDVTPEAPVIISPDLTPVEEEFIPSEPEKETAKSIQMEEETKTPVAEEVIEKKIARPAMKTASAPANLPIAESAPAVRQRETVEPDEPTDEEVKERLNRLMRGEL